MTAIKLHNLIKTGYGNEYKPLMVNIDCIAGVSEDREGYGEVRLNDGYVYTTKECASEIIRLIEEVTK